MFSTCLLLLLGLVLTCLIHFYSVPSCSESAGFSSYLPGFCLFLLAYYYSVPWCNSSATAPQGLALTCLLYGTGFCSYLPATTVCHGATAVRQRQGRVPPPGPIRKSTLCSEFYIVNILRAHVVNILGRIACSKYTRYIQYTCALVCSKYTQYVVIYPSMQ